MVPKSTIKILVVDDDESLRDVLMEVIQESGHECRVAVSAEEGLELFRKELFQVVITDLMMSGMFGIEFINEIKTLAPDTEVLLITSYATLDTAVSALRLGAHDYLTKPFDNIDQVFASVSRVVEKVRLHNEKRLLIESLAEKKLELEELNLSLQSLVVRDALTGLFNRRFLDEALATEIARSQRNKMPCALLFIDVDHFKHYNDNNGHPEGDVLLKTLAGILTKRLRKADNIARYGGEEFVVLLPETTRNNALYCAEQICAMVGNHPFPGREKQPLGLVSVSIGVSSFPEDGDNAPCLLKKADTALYMAKQQGRNRVCLMENGQM